MVSSAIWSLMSRTFCCSFLETALAAAWTSFSFFTSSPICWKSWLKFFMAANCKRHTHTHICVTPYMKHACISATQSNLLTSCGLISHNLEDDGSRSSCMQLELKGLSISNSTQDTFPLQFRASASAASPYIRITLQIRWDTSPHFMLAVLANTCKQGQLDVSFHNQCLSPCSYNIAQKLCTMTLLHMLLRPVLA